MNKGERVALLGLVWGLIGCYEYSLVGIDGGSHDLFYKISGWFFAVSGVIMLFGGIIKATERPRK
jgi:hypothetical protein